MNSAGNTSLKNSQIDELLSRARQSILTGFDTLMTAIEDMAEAQEQGASQRQIAKAVGMSPAWVNQMLRWRRGGYKDGTPFGPQSKAGRQRSQVQAAERKCTPEKHHGTRDLTHGSGAPKACAVPIKTANAFLKAKTSKAQAEAAKTEAHAETDARPNKLNHRTLHIGSRNCLVKTLSLLGSHDAGERDDAALSTENTRKKLGMRWDDLIVPANETKADAANSEKSAS